MTEKLYYLDSYISEFRARVLECNRLENAYEVILDRTAFFPEEGGQTSDNGFIGDARVLHVREENGVVIHTVQSAPTENEVLCKIDFYERLEKMQCHSAEHILCGIIHRLYGYENVGFHLNAEEVVFDVSGILCQEQLDKVEAMANEAVFANLKVETSFPSDEELKGIEYRSKAEIRENVRLVKIGDVDICACCAPHVRMTGEIGLIKILDYMKHRGGTRIRMVAGARALRDYNLKYANIKRISAILSAPQHQTADILEKYVSDAEALRGELKRCRISLAENLGKEFMPEGENAVVLLKGFGMDELRAFSNCARHRVSGILTAISEKDVGFQYIISSDSTDLSALSQRINRDLNGRGGGKKNMISGSFLAEYSAVEDYFINKKYL